MEPEYHEGDIVVFSPAADLTDGCDCFVRLLPDHETTFKRVFFEKLRSNQKRPTRFRLQPLNPAFAPQLVHRNELSGLYKAVWRIQKV